MVHEGFLYRLFPEKYFVINWFSITKYGVSISFSQQAFPLGASLHCQQFDERNTFSNEQSKARTSGVREHIYFRVYTESTNDASEEKRLSHGQTKKARLIGPQSLYMVFQGKV